MTYGKGGRWTMTERRERHVKITKNSFKVGPSKLEWDGKKLVLEFSEITIPHFDKIEGSTLPIDKEDMHVFTTRVPVGVVAAFTPWNFPLNQVVKKVAAAFAAGCTAIVKGPEETPASVAELILSLIHI